MLILFHILWNETWKHSGEPISRGQTAPWGDRPIRLYVHLSEMSIFICSYGCTRAKALVRMEWVVCVHLTVHSPGEFHEAELFHIEQPFFTVLFMRSASALCSGSPVYVILFISLLIFVNLYCYTCGATLSGSSRKGHGYGWMLFLINRFSGLS